MRVKEMHPLCCVSMESPGVGDRSPEASTFRRGLSSASVGSDCNAWRETGTGINVAGVLYKWTNYSKGWRSRWFLLRNGVLSYSKIRPSEDLDQMWTSDDVRVIGDASTVRLSGIDNKGRRKQEKPVGVVHLKISTFRESRSDVQRFYIFTATKTLHLRTNSKKDRVAWINALTSTRNLFSLKPFDDKLCHISANLSISTEKLRNRLLEGGINEILIQECEQIMRSEISGLHGQFKLLCEERSSLLDTLRQWEAANIEVEAPGLLETQYQLGKDEYPSTEQGKYNEWSTTESSDVIEKLELEELSDVDETLFFDTRDSFSNSSSNHPSKTEVQDVVDKCSTYSEPVDRMHAEAEFINCSYPHIERRKKLPDPAEQEKGVSLWSMIKDNVGKDLTRVCLPVYFNEPISSLQKCCEDMEYSYLLDRAYDCGQKGNNLLRVLNVAAFAVSGYASSEGRHCKPFNPLLGETYEAEYPDKAIRFISEKVCHHPTLIACHCEGKGWKFWGDSNLRTKFWGRSIQLDPVGVLTLEFDDGEIFQWSKVTTNIYNLILGKVYCDHHGTLHIRGNRQHSCKLRFREQSILDRNPHQVQGIVEDVMGRKVASLFGKWDESMYYVHGDWFPKAKGCTPPPDASLLWRRNKPPPDLTRYNLTSFAITLNELTPGLKEKLPPTDSRLRPDQRHLENGEYEKANAEKLRLEKRQRMSTKIQENGWKPKWFQKDSEDGSFRYIGGYWEARERGKWDGCPYIFGEFTADVAANTL